MQASMVTNSALCNAALDTLSFCCRIVYSSAGAQAHPTKEALAAALKQRMGTSTHRPSRLKRIILRERMDKSTAQATAHASSMDSFAASLRAEYQDLLRQLQVMTHVLCSSRNGPHSQQSVACFLSSSAAKEQQPEQPSDMIRPCCKPAVSGADAIGCCSSSMHGEPRLRIIAAGTAGERCAEQGSRRSGGQFRCR